MTIHRTVAGVCLAGVVLAGASAGAASAEPEYSCDYGLVEWDSTAITSPSLRGSVDA